MLSRTLKMSFWVLFDHLGALVLVNVLGCVVLLPVLAGLWAASALLPDNVASAVVLALPPLAFGLFVVLPVLAAAASHMVKECLDTREATVRTFFRGLRLYAFPALRLGCLMAIVMACLGVNIWFYLLRVGVSMPWLGYAAGAMALWGLVLMMESALFAIPAMVQKKCNARSALKMGVLLTLDNPLFAAAVSAGVVFLAAVSWVPPFVMMVSWTLAVVWTMCSYEMLSRKYDAVAARNAAMERGEPTGSWRDDLARHDAEDDYLNRGFRDLLFPWMG